jgi:hypothetical protein
MENQEAILVRACLSQLPPLFLVIFVISAAPRTPAEALQREIPYFVDAAGTEYDLEQEAKGATSQLALPPREQLHATLGQAVRRLQRWRVYLRSDGTWAPDPMLGKQDYGDQHYPMEYILPLGYRGAFQVAWGVPGAPPLPIVNNKIEIYIPASGIYETSSALALTTGTVASPEHQFYFEHDGKRTVIPHEPLQPGQVGINYGTTACRGMPNMCYTYFVGSREEWQAATSAKCPTSEAELQVIDSGHECTDVPPGSIQPVAEIVAPPGKPAVMPNEFHGRTLNGRRVVLSIGPGDATSWRFDGPEPIVPDGPALAAELKTYIEGILAKNTGTNLQEAGCSREEMQAGLRASLAGPLHLFRTPYSSKVVGQFVVAKESQNATTYTGLLFARGEQGWKMVQTNCHLDWRRYGMVSSFDSKVSEFVGKAVLQKSIPVVLRRDGTFDSDDPSELQIPEWAEKSFVGNDMNGGELQFTIGDRGRGTWRRLNDPSLEMRTDTVISELNRALDRYIELLSAGNIKGFLAESGEQNDAFEAYRAIEKFGDDSKQANDIYDFLKQTGDGERILAEHGRDHFKAALKKALLEFAIQSVDMPFTLQELKRLRNQNPNIAPRTPFSPDFEAVYVLSQKDPTQPQAIRRMIGHGSTWAFHRECGLLVCAARAVPACLVRKDMASNQEDQILASARIPSDLLKLVECAVSHPSYVQAPATPPTVIFIIRRSPCNSPC